MTRHRVFIGLPVMKALAITTATVRAQAPVLAMAVLFTGEVRGVVDVSGSLVRGLLGGTDTADGCDRRVPR